MRKRSSEKEWVRLLAALLGIIIGAAIFYFGFFYAQVGPLIETLKSLTEIAAIIIGGLWTYTRFIKNREDYPYPEIQHKIIHHQIEFPNLDCDLVYLCVFVTVTNKGRARLDLDGFKIYVRQVLPLHPENEVHAMISDQIVSLNIENLRKGNIPGLFVDHRQRIAWETIGEREWGEFNPVMLKLEPGQTRDYQFDFVIEGEAKVIEVISYIDKNAGWGLSTLHSLTDTEISFTTS